MLLHLELAATDPDLLETKSYAKTIGKIMNNFTVLCQMIDEGVF
jgi:hypothetical protein